MKALPLILTLGLSATAAQAFSGVAGPHSGLRHGGHILGRYGSTLLVPDVPPSFDPPSPSSVGPPPFEEPAFAPAYPQPYFIPNARPRRSGPKIIYIGKPPRTDGPRVIYGTD